MKKQLPYFSYSIAHIALVILGFLGLQMLYSLISVEVRQPGWQEQPVSLFLDRFNYALCFGLGGYLCFGFIPKYVLFKSQPDINRWHFFREKKSPTPSKYLGTSTVGLLGGLGLFTILWFTTTYLIPSQTETGPSPVQIALANRPLLLISHILTTGILTAVLEEFFYRACLTGYLEQTQQFIINKTQIQNDQLPLTHIWVFLIPVILFALVHPGIHAFMLAVGGLFTILYWRMGLWTAILAHSTYNILILLIA